MSHWDPWDYAPQPPRKPRVAAAEKTLWDKTHAAEDVVEYAVEYDDMDGHLHSDEPETANLRPIREDLTAYAAGDGDADAKAYVEARPRYKYGRKPKIFKRTVTYGPWEEI